MLGQRATAQKSNEKTAIPELLSTLALEGCIVTIDAMGTQSNIARTIRDRGTDYVLTVKDNHPILAESIRDFFAQFKAAPQRTPHSVVETVEKDHGRLETLRCYAFDQITCLHDAQQWPDQKSFTVIESERCIKRQSHPRAAPLHQQLGRRCSAAFASPSAPTGASKTSCTGAWM